MLKIIATQEKPVGAYAVLKHLGDVLDDPKPPTVYRAIDFWVKTRFVHRIESLNAYTVCQENHRHHGGQFMVCQGCGDAIEMHLCQMPETLMRKTQAHSFSVSKWQVEVYGLCSACQH